MSSSEKFCLKWNDFEGNVSNAFRELREEKDFFDVTLACDDEQIQAHKVIVSACSPFFRNVLRRNPHQHPLLYLKGVKYRELLAVLNFMYQGEVNVAQDDLNSFLAVAEELKVKGLTQGNSDSQKSQQSHFRPPAESKPEKKSRPIPPPPLTTQDDDDIEDVTPVKTEPGGLVETHYEQQSGAVALEDTYQDEEESYDYEAYDDGSGALDPSTGMPYADGNKDFETEIKSRMENLGSGRWQCKDCFYVSQSCNVKKHIESKHLIPQDYSCSHCGQVLRGRHAYNNHLYIVHKKNQSM